MDKSVLLRMSNIHYRLQNGTPVLNGIDFELNYGEIHALTGEHRSGKSSLMRVLNGDIIPDRGEIYLGGRRVEMQIPVDAASRKIGMVQQNLTIIPSVNILENIFMHRLPPAWFGIKRYSAMAAECRRLLAKFGLELDPLKTVSSLSIPEQQCVEIARVLSLEPDILIIDEMSNRLTPQQLRHLYQVLNEQKEMGRSVVIINANIEDIFELADRVTVIRDGYRISTDLIADMDRMRLLRLAYSFIVDDQDNSPGAEDASSDFFYMRSYNENLMKDLPVGVIILGQDNSVVYCNSAADDALDGKSDYFSNGIELLLSDQCPENHRKILDAVKNRERKVWDGIPFGTSRFMKLRTVPLRNDEMEFTGTILVLEDVSLDHQIRDYMAKSEKFASTAEIAAGVAHEINNPLGIIQNYLEIMKLKETDEDSRTKLFKIEKELSRIVEIVGSLLSFSKVKAESYTLIHLSDLLDEILTLLSHRFVEKKIHIARRCSDRSIIISGDEGRLKQVFINLLVNSAEAVLNSGKIGIDISREESPDETYALIAVSDNGSGIPDDILEDIFNPFFSTKATKKNTGLGLSICRHIIEAHNGTIRVESKPGEGAVFTVRLPVKDCRSNAPAEG